MPTRTSPTRQRRAARTRRAILQVALELIEQQGAEKLSLREVARQIDYSPAALYEYFPNKDALLQALRGEVDRQLEQVLRALPAAPTFAERLVQAGLACLRYAQEQPQRFSLLASPNQVPAADPGARLVFAEILQGGAQAGEFLPDPALGTVEMAHMLWALVYGLAALGQSSPAEGQAEEALRWLVRAIPTHESQNSNTDHQKSNET